MISVGPLMPTPGYVVMVPVGVMRPITLLSKSVNHRLPSGPAVIPCGVPSPGAV